MASDEFPPDALQHQFELENTSVSPVVKILISLLSNMPLVWPFDKAMQALADRLNADAQERIRLVLDVAVGEIRKHDAEIRQIRESMSKEQAEKRERAAKELLVDAARKAANTRSIERVKRIGIILANGIIERQSLDEDEIEEMMRVATELGDEDAKYLAELVRIEGTQVPNTGLMPRLTAHNFWEHGFWWRTPNNQAESVFRKLESYGLVANIPPPNNLNITADIPTRFGLLAKGLRFARLMERKST